MQRPTLQAVSLAIHLLLLGYTAASLAGAPPAETIERLGAAVTFLDSESFSGNLTMTTHTVISKVNGPAEHSELIVERLTKQRGVVVTREVLRATRDEEDATEQVRTERAGQAGPQDDDPEKAPSENKT